MLRHRPATVEERARCGRFSRACARRTAKACLAGPRSSHGCLRRFGTACIDGRFLRGGRQPTPWVNVLPRLLGKLGLWHGIPSSGRCPSCCAALPAALGRAAWRAAVAPTVAVRRYAILRGWGPSARRLAMWGKALHAAWLRARHNGGAGRCCTSARGFTRPTRTHVSRASAGARKYWRSPFGGPGRPHRRGFARPAARERRRWRQQCGRGRRARWRRAWWRPAARRDESACAKRRPGDAARPLPRVQRGAAHHAREPAGCDVSAQPAVRQQAPLLRGAPQSGSVRSGGRGGKILPEV
jgi:hypothetical protein